MIDNVRRITVRFFSDACVWTMEDKIRECLRNDLRLVRKPLWSCNSESIAGIANSVKGIPRASNSQPTVLRRCSPKGGRDHTPVVFFHIIFLITNSGQLLTQWMWRKTSSILLTFQPWVTHQDTFDQKWLEARVGVIGEMSENSWKQTLRAAVREMAKVQYPSLRMHERTRSWHVKPIDSAK